MKHCLMDFDKYCQSWIWMNLHVHVNFCTHTRTTRCTNTAQNHEHMYQRSGTLYGIFCKAAAGWAAVQHQTSVQPLDHAHTTMHEHTHTQQARLNICPAGSVPF